MRNRRLLTIAFATSSLVAVSGIAFAVVQSVDPTPAPQVVIPASSTQSPEAPSVTPEPGDDNGKNAKDGKDDPATHDASDDHGGATAGTDDNGQDANDVGDDNGGVSGSDDSTSGSDSSGSGSGDSGSDSGSSSGDSGSGGSDGGSGDSGSGGGGSDG